ncbi:MAG: hypothetical protein DCO96_10260 [Fluviicola sp. XM-24bin1]|nr:MAG: hypothetical protein DCO96_10260 [Fluviicola sp. XM-24bin1]
MKFLILLFPFILAFGGNLNSVNNKHLDCNYIKDYYPYVHSGMLEYERGNYQESYEYFSKAFDKCPPKNTLEYYELDKMGELCVRLQNFKEAQKYIRESCLQGRNLDYIIDDSLYLDFFDSKHGRDLIKNYTSYREEYLSSINLELRNELILMKSEDQKYRQSGHQFFKDNFEKAKTIDSLNSNRLIQIFDSIGYPNSNIIGNHTLDGGHIRLNIVLLHTEDSIRLNYFAPKINEFVRSGKCDPELLGNLMDQFYLYNKEPQIYGTYSGMNSPYAHMIHRDSVNLNRLSIGLPTLEQKEELDSLKRVNYPWLYGQ